MMLTRARILAATLAAAAALALPGAVAHASVLPCTADGGQGLSGDVSSLVVNCVNALVGGH